MTSSTLLAVVVALLLGCCSEALAHDQYHEWRMPDSPSTSCCHDRDCRPVRAEQDIDGRWTAWVDGQRIPVPARKVMKMPSPDGRSHWCGQGENTYCFVGAEPKS